ncbi:hypothetical protein L9F63_001269, partial [Diploptera punctata]
AVQTTARGLHPAHHGFSYGPHFRIVKQVLREGAWKQSVMCYFYGTTAVVNSGCSEIEWFIDFHPVCLQNHSSEEDIFFGSRFTSRKRTS